MASDATKRWVEVGNGRIFRMDGSSLAAAPLELAKCHSAYPTGTNVPVIFGTATGDAWPFDKDGNLVILGRTGSAPGEIIVAMKIDGSVSEVLRFAPSGAGIFYYNIKASTGTYNGSHLQLGNYHLWVDQNGKLRIKNGEPTSATDGVVVGTQTA